ncbi:hypothetical protein GALL_494460 [mine drainage metagenome]|uniref:Uncharacterized protein n=1 Tax=mine drainage metagenome TaxID=410659 RepID=A0A1J5PMY7_9ZZZZ
MRDALIEIAIQIDFLEPGQTGPQPVPQLAYALIFRSQFQAGDAECFTHADDLVDRQGAGAKAALVAASMHLRFQAHSWLAAHIQGADAFWSVGFVRGKTHQINRQLGQVDLHLASGLRGVDMEHDAFVAADIANGFNVLNHADLVIDQHHRGEDGIRADRRLKRFKVDQAVFEWREISRAETLALQFPYRIQHGLVLGFDRDQVFSTTGVKVSRALDGKVVGFCRATRPDDFLGVTVDQCGHLLTRSLDTFLRVPTECMGATGRITEKLGKVRNHLLGHTRINRCSR